MRPEQVAEGVTAAYGTCEDLSFCYGQGSVFSGLVADSDLDLVMIWNGEVPPADQRPAYQACDPGVSPSQFDLKHTGLDKLRAGGWPVDVVHFPRTVFDGWLRDVRHGNGWQEPAWPLPLFAVAGFAYGVIVSDADGHGHRVLNDVRRFPRPLMDRTRETLRTDWPALDAELASCVRRGDDWLFHELLTRSLRHTYVTWFAAHRVYCPHPKRLSQWLHRFNMEAHIIDLERRIWQVAALADRHAAVAATVEAVLSVAEDAHEER